MFMLCAPLIAAIEPNPTRPLARIDPALSALPADNRLVNVLIALPPSAEVARSGQHGLFAKAALVEGKRAAAEKAGRGVVAWLERGNYRYRNYWIANAIWARVPANKIETLASRADVRFLASDPSLRGIDPQPAEGSMPKAINAIEWGIDRIGAPLVWAEGVLGQGAVVAGADTGYQWDHPALKNQYRGWNAQTAQATHDYNWHDAIHEDNPLSAGLNSCGFNRMSPCDDGAHGTHTMGTVVGSDGGSNQIGVAPQARWIGCRNMEEGWGTPSTYIECMQFFAAPTDAQGNNPRADLAPHVINNSWGCPSEEGCSAQTDVLMASAIDTLHQLGIVFVVSAGNSGNSTSSGCSTVRDAPATLEQSFTVGSTNSAEAIAGSSSRGPVGGRLAPTISAPGVSVRSSVPPNAYQSFSGTSMAGPHVAGAVALLVSRHPWLANHPSRIRSVLEATAVPRTSTQNCGSYLGSAVPNAVFGHGRLDVKAALDVINDWLFLDSFNGR